MTNVFAWTLKDVIVLSVIGLLLLFLIGAWVTEKINFLWHRLQKKWRKK